MKIITIRTSLGCCAFLMAAVLAADDTGQIQILRVVTYNISADINGVTTPNFGLNEVLEGIGEENYLGIERPLDILALQETTSNDITVAPIVTDLNTFYNGTAIYAQSAVQGGQSGSNAFGNGPNAVVYNTKTLQLVNSVGVGTPRGSFNGEYRQVMRYQFQPVGGTAANSFYVYVTHMKSSFSGDPYTNEFYRNEEAQIIRNDAGTLYTAANPNPSILYVGDFNLSGSAPISNGTNSVSAYQTMTAAGPGQAVDPLNINPQNNNITWSGDAAYASIMTESVYNLYYRDDFQLMTKNVYDGSTPQGLKYIPDSLHTFGNDGSIGLDGYVFDSANTALNNIDPNGSIPALYLQYYLYFASDHYPVVADYTIPVPEPATLVLLSVGSLLLAMRGAKSLRNP